MVAAFFPARYYLGCHKRQLESGRVRSLPPSPPESREQRVYVYATKVAWLYLPSLDHFSMRYGMTPRLFDYFTNRSMYNHSRAQVSLQPVSRLTRITPLFSLLLGLISLASSAFAAPPAYLAPDEPQVQFRNLLEQIVDTLPEKKRGDTSSEPFNLTPAASKAVAQLRTGDIDGAKSRLISSIPDKWEDVYKTPNIERSFHLLGLIAMKQGDTQLAEQYLSKALLVRGSDPAILYTQATLYAQRGELDKATTALTESNWFIPPSRPDPLLNRTEILSAHAFLLIRAEKFTEAINLIKSSHSEDQEIAVPLAILSAYAYSKLGEAPNALNQLKDLPEQDQEIPDASLILAWCLLGSGKVVELPGARVPPQIARALDLSMRVLKNEEATAKQRVKALAIQTYTLAELGKIEQAEALYKNYAPLLLAQDKQGSAAELQRMKQQLEADSAALAIKQEQQKKLEEETNPK